MHRGLKLFLCKGVSAYTNDDVLIIVGRLFFLSTTHKRHCSLMDLSPRQCSRMFNLFACGADGANAKLRVMGSACDGKRSLIV